MTDTNLESHIKILEIAANMAIACNPNNYAAMKHAFTECHSALMVAINKSHESLKKSDNL